MTNLDCSVKTCGYNCDSCCSKHEIDVKGQGALNAEMTCCGSFSQDSQASNSADSHASRETEVKCAVENCAYNDSHFCAAPSVDITGCNACDCGQTECATFKQRNM